MRVRKRQLLGMWLLGLAVLVCLATASCESKHIQTSPQGLKQTDSEGQVDKEMTPLSKEQIPAIADAVADERGWWPQERRTYDEGNVIWRRCLNGRTLRGLEGRNYQVVWYGRVHAILGGDLAVVVDRNTGAVLKVIEWP
jgi:hypothetical protein